MGLGAYSAEKQPGFDGKARALVSVEARDVMPGVHFGIVSDVDVNPAQYHPLGGKHPTTWNSATQNHDDTGARLGPPHLKSVILCVDNDKEAVDVFVANSVDRVLLDYHMPGMNGAPQQVI